MKQIWLEKDGTLQVLTDENLDDVKRVLVTRKGSIYGGLYYPDEKPKDKWRYYEGMYSCEKCGAELDDMSPYCPMCGVDMRGEEE